MASGKILKTPNSARTAHIRKREKESSVRATWGGDEKGFDV
jgi:hypothetical protein